MHVSQVERLAYPVHAQGSAQTSSPASAEICRCCRCDRGCVSGEEGGGSVDGFAGYVEDAFEVGDGTDSKWLAGVSGEGGK